MLDNESPEGLTKGAAGERVAWVSRSEEHYMSRSKQDDGNYF
jgi:hypothetical protein